jgi:hypothetical protein
MPSKARFDATVDGDTMTGTVNFGIRAAPGPFTGTRELNAS